MTVDEFMPLLWAYQDQPGNITGGSLHVVVDDGNTKDRDVVFCIEEARRYNDTKGERLAGLLLDMSRTQRRKVSQRFYRRNRA